MSLSEGYCLHCGAVRVDTSAGYQEGWTCAGVGNGDEGCGRPDVFLDHEEYVEALEDLAANPAPEVERLVERLAEYAEAGAALPLSQLRHDVQTHTFKTDAERRVFRLVVRLIEAEREAAKPATRRAKRVAVGGAL